MLIAHDSATNGPVMPRALVLAHVYGLYFALRGTTLIKHSIDIDANFSIMFLLLLVHVCYDYINCVLGKKKQRFYRNRIASSTEFIKELTVNVYGQSYLKMGVNRLNLLSNMSILTHYI